ncbi:hypothetical protein JHK82_031593 [Glycine max]|nr:hypothetical protein JHK82_031593 [Glycine max]
MEHMYPKIVDLIITTLQDGPVWKKAQVVPKSRKDDSGSNNDMKKIPVKNRMERWKATGVVALSECNLEVIPDEVWVCGSSARVLDCNNNSITDVPDEIARLTGLDKGDACSVINGGWQKAEIPSYKHKIALYLGNTRMKSLPSKLFKTCLQLSTLDLHNTKITIDLLRRDVAGIYGFTIHGFDV